MPTTPSSALRRYLSSVALVCTCVLVCVLVVGCVLTCVDVLHTSVPHTSAPPPTSPISSTASTHDTTQPQPPVRVFWTGGYDSTFRVLQACIDEQRTVIPYYLAGDIDNRTSGRTRRKNHAEEQRAMQRVREGLHRAFPEAAHRLQPLVVVDHVPIRKSTRAAMRTLHANKVVRRRTCQYGSLGEYSLRLGQPVEIGIVRDGHSNAGIYHGVHDKVAGVGASCRLTDEAIARHPEYALFRNCVFPLMHLDKAEMLRIATAHGYAHLLKHTWSCWYPTADGTPCNKCLMCRERVLQSV